MSSTGFFVDEDLLERALTKQAHLDYFHSFDVFLTSNDQSVDQLTEHLIDEYVQKTKSTNFQRSKYTRTLKVMLVNLLYCHQTSSKLFLAISRTSNHYSIDRRYNPLGVNVTAINKLIDWLDNENYIVQFKGIHFDGRASRTRIRSKDKLITLYKKMKAIAAKIVSRPDREVILLKDKDKKPKPYTDNKETNRMRKAVQDLNLLLENTKLELNGVILPVQYLYRVFNDGSFKLGGRFYDGSFQNLPKSERKHLLINGVQATEWDFSTLHPSILYNEAKQPMPSDPYLPPGYNSNARDFLKLFFLILLNSSSEDQASRAGLSLASNKYRQLGFNSKNRIEQVLQDLKTHNQLIQKSFCKCVAKRLMYIDSKIAEKVLTDFVKQDIPIYPVHDSFIVASSYGSQLNQIMNKAYTSITRGTIQVGKVY